MFCLFLLSFLPSISSDDFDEITYRKYQTAEQAAYNLKHLIAFSKIDLTNINLTDVYVPCEGPWVRGFPQFIPNFNYLEDARIIIATVYNDPTIGPVLYFETKGKGFHLAIYYVMEESIDDWRLYLTIDMSCRHWNKVFEMNYIMKNFTDTVQNLYSNLQMVSVNNVFLESYQLEFCDGSVAKYFVHPNDTVSQDDPVILHDIVSFLRDTKRSVPGYFFGTTHSIVPIPYHQMDMTINGRRMQLEFDVDLLKFTRGREFPCEGHITGRRVNFY